MHNGNFKEVKTYEGDFEENKTFMSTGARYAWPSEGLKIWGCQDKNDTPKYVLNNGQIWST